MSRRWQTARGKLSPTCYSTSRMFVSKPATMEILARLPNLQRGETDFFSGEPLRSLSTLVYSENVDLQRSASLTFAEITERGSSQWSATITMC